MQLRIKKREWMRIFFCFGILFTCCISNRVVRPDIPPFTAHKVASASTKVTPITSVELGDMKVIFEQSTLQDVIHHVGIGTMTHEGDAGNSKYWLCYSINVNPDHQQRIWLISDGEMGGQHHAITGFIATTEPTKNIRPSCTLLEKPPVPMKTDLGLRLGSTEQDLERLLGKPSGVDKDWKSYFRVDTIKPEKITPVEEYQQSTLLEVKVKDGKIVTIQASKVTTN